MYRWIVRLLMIINRSRSQAVITRGSENEVSERPVGVPAGEVNAPL